MPREFPETLCCMFLHFTNMPFGNKYKINQPKHSPAFQTVPEINTRISLKLKRKDPTPVFR